MRPFASAVVQDVGVGAFGFFKGVGKNGEMVERSVVVDHLGQLYYGGLQPDWFDGDRTEGVAEDFTD